MSQSTVENLNESSSIDCYDYSPLPVGEYIRYLVLEPGQGLDPLICTLHVSRLEEASFEAISYTWGTPERCHIITCDGQTLRITKNLRDALRQVRKPTKHRKVWADSICINQEDWQEKGHQVGLMGQIYGKSDCTLICLGPLNYEFTHSRKVAGLISDADRMIQRIFDQEDYSWDWNSFPYSDSNDQLLSDSRCESLKILLSQPWFKRGWVIQEAALSFTAEVLWGDVIFNWFSLIRFLYWAFFRAPQLTSIFSYCLSGGIHMESFRRRHKAEAMTFVPQADMNYLSFLDILDVARFSEVTDPRDRIYAFQALPNSSKWTPTIQPDYEKSSLHTFSKFGREYMRMNHSTDLLHYIQNDDGAISTSSEFASWIPRWDVSIYHYSPLCMKGLKIINSNYSVNSQPTIVGSNILKVRGIIFDCVTVASQCFNQESASSDDIASFWSYLPKSEKKSPYRLCSPMAAFMTTVTAGRFFGSWAMWKENKAAYQVHIHERNQQSGRYHHVENSSEEHPPHGDIKVVHHFVKGWTHNRKLIQTDRGYYGLAPGIAREGDLCCIIFGTYTPFILQKTQQPGHYKLLGEVYIPSKETIQDGLYKGTHVRLGQQDGQDWLEWGLEEEDIFLC